MPSPTERGRNNKRLEELKPDGCPVQIVLIRALDLHSRDLADPQRPSARHIHRAVDLGRVAFATALGDARTGRIDDHLLATADLALEPARGHLLLARHARMRSSVFSCAAGRRMRLSTSGLACWNGMSR